LPPSNAAEVYTIQDREKDFGGKETHLATFKLFTDWTWIAMVMRCDSL
jgi:hypothetical protein